MLGSALASLVARLNDRTISDKRVLEQRRDAIRDEIAELRAALAVSLADVQHHASDVARIEAEQREPSVHVPSSPTGSRSAVVPNLGQSHALLGQSRSQVLQSV